MKGIVILLALSWEITTSGELTNYATRSFPRNSRILLFLGYVVLVAFGVLTIFPTTYRITQRMTGFDSEQWVLRGILLIGVPFLMVAFSSRTAHLLWHKEPEASKLSKAAVEPEGGAAEPA
jgi:cell division protein FtsW (lipid II flippase)